MADLQVKTPNVMTSASAQVQRANGITISCDGNGRYTINGTATADSTIYFDIPEFITPNSAQQGGNGTFRFFNPVIGSNSGDSRIYFYVGTTAAENYQLTIADRQSTTYGGSLASQRINKIAFFIRSGVTVANAVVTPMFTDDGTIPIIYQPYSATGWLHSLRKLTTATEAVENPLYTDGTAITAYTIKGNTVQNGTPTPSNPVEVNGVGVRTENLFDVSKETKNTYITYDGTTGASSVTNTSDYTEINTPIITLSGTRTTELEHSNNRGYTFYTDDKTVIEGSTYSPDISIPVNITVPNNAVYIRFSYDKSFEGSVMLNSGSTAKPYEPYGYKIPISSGGVTTNIYLSEPLYKIGDYADIINSDGTVTRNIGCIDLSDYNFTYISQFQIWECTTIPNIKYVSISTELGNALAENYINHTATGLYAAVNNFAISPSSVSVNTGSGSISPSGKLYYALLSSTTETITAPSIPTTEGANSITVDTTVQPSEFTATWTGWHNAIVKEWDGSDWQ